MSGQAYDPRNPWVDGFDSTAGVPFVPLAKWELADQWPTGKRSRTREAGGAITRPVLLVAVRVEDTSRRARRRFWPCSCSRPMNAEHAPACDWWNNRRPGTWWRNPERIDR